MGITNFFKVLILFGAANMLTACNPPDFGKIKPDFSQLQKVPTSILSIGKRSDGSKKRWGLFAVD